MHQFLTFIATLVLAFFVRAQKEVQITFDIPSVDTSEHVAIDVFRFYFSSVGFEFDDGTQYTVPQGYYLIDMEQPTSLELTFTNIPDKKITGLFYTIGTDSLINVSGAIEGDLDPIKGMYWAWNSGYINFKLEGQKEGQPFTFHVGGYSGPYATARQRRHDVTFSNENAITLKVDYLKFLNHIDLASMHSIMIPGEQASQLADYYQTIFSVE